MHFENRLEITQSQKLVMNMKLKQSLKILNMSRPELEEEIKREAEINPLLEAEKKEDGIDWEKYIKDMDRTPEIKDRNEFAYNVDNEVDFENMIKYSGTMHDYLMNEIMYFDLNDKEKGICEYIIDSLDEDGYLRETDKEIARAVGCNLSEFRECLGIIHQIDPVGVGARNLSECLEIQIRAKGIEDDILESIIRNDLELIGKNKLRDISRKYKISIDKCKKYVEVIKTLDPKPGRVYVDENSIYVQPDVIVYVEDGTVVVKENEKDRYNLKINTYYKDIIKNNDTDLEAKEFVKDKLNSASNLIKNIDSRKNTVMRIALEISKRQKEFMLKGEKYIKPMRMKDIAEELECHESTVSRGVNGKYMLTPFGIYEFKYFFGGVIESSCGESESSGQSVKLQIKEIIDGENKRKPISDDMISKVLKEKGISIARRTVAKYREELGIPSSSRRKEY